MFPSGSWTGHWDQNGYGRQDMHDLTIAFQGGNLRGTGWDCIGKFSLTGEVSDKHQVRIVKNYQDRHSVVYLGEHDGEGTISGAWALQMDHGTFAIRPAGGFREESLPIDELTF